MMALLPTHFGMSVRWLFVSQKFAKQHKWVIGRLGLDRKTHPSVILSERLIYMMKITEKMTMAEYDGFTRDRLPAKIPEWSNEDPRRKRGDSIYDFSGGAPSQRQSVHNEGNRKRDLGGEYALLSKHFWYFGRNAIMIPDLMKNLIRAGQGHRSLSNDPWVNEFLQWVSNFQLMPNHLYGLPAGKSFDCAGIDQPIQSIPEEWKYKRC